VEQTACWRRDHPRIHGRIAGRPAEDRHIVRFATEYADLACDDKVTLNVAPAIAVSQMGVQI
jgi:hypothetical protein